jgi:hypothetical protein
VKSLGAGVRARRIGQGNAVDACPTSTVDPLVQTNESEVDRIGLSPFQRAAGRTPCTKLEGRRGCAVCHPGGERSMDFDLIVEYLHDFGWASEVVFPIAMFQPSRVDVKSAFACSTRDRRVRALRANSPTPGTRRFCMAQRSEAVFSASAELTSRSTHQSRTCFTDARVPGRQHDSHCRVHRARHGR